MIINFLSSILGLLMDVFFKGLTLIGYPRLWAGVVLFTIATRFIFLPQRISGFKSTLLEPVVKRDILAADPNFFEKTKDKDLTVKRAALKKEINKKYKLSNSSGCLTTLIQFPLLIALFHVVQNPQEFVPSLELYQNVPNVNTIFGVSLSAIPLKNISFNSVEGFILCVPFIIALSTVIKMWPSIKRTKTRNQKIVAVSLCGLLVVLIGWLSSTLPLVVSLYWLVGDLTYMVFDFFIKKTVSKNKRIVQILADFNDEATRNTASEPLTSEEDKETTACVTPSDESLSDAPCCDTSSNDNKDYV